MLLGRTSSDRILQHAQTLVAELVADREVGPRTEQAPQSNAKAVCTVRGCRPTPNHLCMPFTRWYCGKKGVSDLFNSAVVSCSDQSL
jgi:hypothetical protein